MKLPDFSEMYADSLFDGRLKFCHLVFFPRNCSEVELHTKSNKPFLFKIISVETGTDINLATIQHAHNLHTVGSPPPTPISPSLQSPGLSPTGFGAGSLSQQLCAICGDKATGK